MVSLLAIYEESLGLLDQFLCSEAASLGLEICPSSDGQDCFRLSGQELFVSTREPSIDGQERTRWLHLSGGSTLFDPMHEVFHHLLASTLKPTEVILIDHDIEFADDQVTYAPKKCRPRELLEVIESGYYGSGLHSVRAFRRDIAGSFEEWSRAAREMGFGWSEIGDYGVLDVRWSERGWPESEFDPLTGVSTEGPFFCTLYRLLEETSGTLLTVSLTEVIPNPDRSFDCWRKFLPEVAQTIREQLGPNDLLARLYSPRRFAILKPGLTKASSKEALAKLAGQLRAAFTSPKFIKGALGSVSWPDDVGGEEYPVDFLFERACGIEDRPDSIWL